MDFFARQERSRRTTCFLLVMFLLAGLAIVLAVTLVVAGIVRLYVSPPTPVALVDDVSWLQWASGNAGLLGAVAGGTAGFIGLASLYRSATLARGGGQVARMLGATEIKGEGRDLASQRLMNVVEEMAIASGLPLPEIYVLEQEQGINAFAAGLTPSDAAVAVTRGALERLNREELQGVIAHEFSHIVNGDMRLNQQLIGLAFGILVLSLMGRWLMRVARFGGRGGRNSGGVAAAMVVGVALAVIGWLGVFFSRLIKAGISRQRETLADASAVQFTRNPGGLAGALKKIGGYGATLASVESEEVAHMLFEHGSKAFTGWFATHPPLEERILALDPNFTPADYPAPDPPLQSAEPADSGVLISPLAEAAPEVTPDKALEHTGRTASAELAVALRIALPQPLYEAAHSKESSLLLVLALALGRADAVRTRQAELLEKQLGRARAARCEELRVVLDQLDDRLRLPLLELAVPALKQRPVAQLEYLFGLMARLREMNPRQRLFDHVSIQVMSAYLADVPELGFKPQASAGRLSVDQALTTALKVVAAYGHEESASAQAAFEAGLAAIGADGVRLSESQFKPLDEARRVENLNQALVRLSGLRPRAKRRILTAILACIRHDRQVAVAEMELFRGIAATLGCPIPPMAPLT